MRQKDHSRDREKTCAGIRLRWQTAVLAAGLLLSACGPARADQSGSWEGSLSGEAGMETSSSVGASGQAESKMETRELFAMDTYMTLAAYGSRAGEALDKAEAEIMRLDSLWNTESSGSELARINESGSAVLSEDTEDLIRRSQELCRETEGAFDISVYPIKELWGFTDQNYRVPEKEEIDGLLPLVDSSRIRLGEEVSFEEPGMKIDFGAIAKGFTSSRIMDIFETCQVSGMVNLGGNVQVRGPKQDGSKWRIGVRRPELADQEGSGQPQTISQALGDLEYVGVVESRSDAVITSGGYERYFEKDGIVYPHIMDPKTGYPARSGLLSVTIVSGDGTLADGLSTSLFVMGRERAETYWRDHSDSFDFILIDEEGKLYVSEGLEGRFTSDLEISWVKK